MKFIRSSFARLVRNIGSKLNLCGLNSQRVAALRIWTFPNPSFPHAFSRSTMLTALRVSKDGNPGECSDWTHDPFDLTQGRGEHSRTTIKTFAGDDPSDKFNFNFPAACCGRIRPTCGGTYRDLFRCVNVSKPVSSRGYARTRTGT